jgi:hypothetical protein
MRAAVQRTGADGVPKLDLGRPREGGICEYWFCGECNHKTGVWDEEYIRLCRHLVLHLHNGPERPRQRLMGTLPQLDVGAVVRSIWAWSFALIPSLLDCYPGLARSVLTGDPVEPPSDVDLLLGITMSLRIWAIAQPDAWLVENGRDGFHQRSSGILVPGPRVEMLPMSVVASPPFSVVLAHHERPNHVPHVVVGEWLLDRAGVRRDVVIDLPMVQVIDEDSARPLSYASLVPAPARSG